MTLARILQLFLLVITAFLMLAVGVWFQKCRSDRELDKRPPEELTEEQAGDAVEDTEQAGRFNLTEGQASSVRRGRAPAREADREAVEAFADAVVDSARVDSGPALLPPARAWREGDRGGLAVVDSRRQWRVEEWQCDEGRRWEAGTRDSVMYSNCARGWLGWLPEWGKTAAMCGAVGGATYGIARISGYEEPVIPAAAATGGCVLLRVY